MSRVARKTARELIVFAKSLKIKANFWDPRSTSAFEFARQMQSPKLKKVNPAFECSFTVVETNDPPKLSAEFLDGSKWETETTGHHLTSLRAQFFQRAADAEDNSDLSVNEPVGGKKPGDKGGKGGKK